MKQVAVFYTYEDFLSDYERLAGRLAELKTINEKSTQEWTLHEEEALEMKVTFDFMDAIGLFADVDQNMQRTLAEHAIRQVEALQRTVAELPRIFAEMAAGAEMAAAEDEAPPEDEAQQKGTVN